MKTDKQLLVEYTKLMNSDWKSRSRQSQIREELASRAKGDTKRLRVAIRRLIRSTAWTLEDCHYWPLIDHGKRPVAATMHGRIELRHFRENPRSSNKMEVRFSPADEERTLRYLKAIIDATKL